MLKKINPETAYMTVNWGVRGIVLWAVCLLTYYWWYALFRKIYEVIEIFSIKEITIVSIMIVILIVSYVLIYKYTSTMLALSSKKNSQKGSV